MWHDGMGIGLMVFLWIVIAGAAIVAIRYSMIGAGRDRASGDDPEVVLKRRFAAGELTEADYRARLRVLRE